MGNVAMTTPPPATAPVGYAALVERFHLQVVPHHRTSYVAHRGGHRELKENGAHQYVYPSSYAPEQSVGEQLEFALKYDGTNLEILKAVFAVAEKSEIEAYISGKPNGKYARRIWYFYEFLTGKMLDLPDLKAGNYVLALEEREYYTAGRRRVPRQRIDDNLLGTPAFCPMVRRTAALTKAESLELNKKAADLFRSYDTDTISRAIAYLYTKETLSSFQIEREKPSHDRAERFASMLRRVPQIKTLSHDVILEVRNLIVDPRYRRDDYRRDEEVYIGESLTFYHQKVHFVGAPASRVKPLMDGLLACYERMRSSAVHPVVMAAALSFGFVFIHPFDDGNGRTHRFLIHYVLATNGFTPDGVIFPVSAAMLGTMKDYDACLETFSRLVMPLVRYDLDEAGRLSIIESPVDAYRYFDATVMVNYLFDCIERTIAVDFKQELDFIVAFRTTKNAVRDIVDMPDRKIDLFIRFCLQNGGRLSKNKAQKEFPELSPEEIAALEQAVRDGIGDTAIALQGTL